jgi:hypothetical protein|tara:strand:- start:1374 stop:1595 length:222 start_codon:yes stop_codon:yes gene_type:complete
MASDNDWYSDESDETFYREKESRMWSEMGELNNDIIATWDYIKQKIIEVKVMEKKYIDMEENWNEYCEARSNA